MKLLTIQRGKATNREQVRGTDIRNLIGFVEGTTDRAQKCGHYRSCEEAHAFSESSRGRFYQLTIQSS